MRTIVRNDTTTRVMERKAEPVRVTERTTGPQASVSVVSLPLPAGVESVAVASPLAPGVAKAFATAIEQPSGGEMLIVAGYSGTIEAPTIHFSGSVSNAGTHTLRVTFFS